jgi:hypothetical protein
MHWLDPAYLPETRGILDRFLLDPRGDVDGMLLTDGTEVHFSSYLSSQIVPGLLPGAEVTVRGVRPLGVDIVDAVFLRTPDGTQIVDRGPPGRGRGRVGYVIMERDDRSPEIIRARRPVDVEGVVRRALHGPKGETSGVLLDDGRIVKMPVHTEGLPPDMLAPGDKLVARGESVTSTLGTVVDAHEFTVSMAPLPLVDTAVRMSDSVAGAV